MNRRGMRSLAACAVVLLGLAAAGCGRQGPPVLTIGGDFELIDQDNKTFELTSLRGKAVLIFFGYTACPDVCPTTMSKLATVYRELGADASRVQTVYISVDTQRDTPGVLKEYLGNFKSVQAIGLTGSVADIDNVTKLFGALYQINAMPGAAAAHEPYSVAHTTSVYALDANGRTRVVFPYGATAEEMAKGIREILTTERRT